jgi:hypothetical protein
VGAPTQQTTNYFRVKRRLQPLAAMSKVFVRRRVEDLAPKLLALLKDKDSNDELLANTAETFSVELRRIPALLEDFDIQSHVYTLYNVDLDVLERLEKLAPRELMDALDMVASVFSRRERDAKQAALGNFNPTCL